MSRFKTQKTYKEAIKIPYMASGTASGQTNPYRIANTPFTIPTTNTVTKEVQVIDEELKQLMRDLLQEIKNLNEKLL